jgi:hypothetical protein
MPRPRVWSANSGCESGSREITIGVAQQAVRPRLAFELQSAKPRLYSLFLIRIELHSIEELNKYGLH